MKDYITSDVSIQLKGIWTVSEGLLFTCLTFVKALILWASAPTSAK